MSFWKELKSTSSTNADSAIIMVVIESIGSSPGRQGFKMAFTSSSEMIGSIGGGFMEHKLVELSKSLLKDNNFKPFVKRQIHKSNISHDKSGMICSGEQTVAFYKLTYDQINELAALEDNTYLLFDENGINEDKAIKSVQIDKDQWQYFERIGEKPSIYIIGGGHVGLSLSRTMLHLDFDVHVLDDRDHLNTMESNTYATSKQVVDYNEIEKYIPEGDDIYVSLVSFGFRTDEQCMRRLLGRKYKYFGVMGSQAKMDKLLQNLKEDGFSKEDINRVHTPIGLNIHSKTPAEIAISIAAEIINIKNA